MEKIKKIALASLATGAKAVYDPVTPFATGFVIGVLITKLIIIRVMKRKVKGG